MSAFKSLLLRLGRFLRFNWTGCSQLEDWVSWVMGFVCHWVYQLNRNLCCGVVPGQPVDTQLTVFMKHKALPSDLTLTVLATYYTNAGRFSVSSDRVNLYR